MVLLALLKSFYVPNNSVLASFWSSIAEKSVMTWVTWTFAIIAGIFYYSKFPLWIWIIVLLVLLSFPFLIKLFLGLSKNFATMKPLYAIQIPKVIAVQTFSTILCYVQYWLILNCLLPSVSGRPLSEWHLRNFLILSLLLFPVWDCGGICYPFLAGAGFSAEQAVSTTLTLFLFMMFCLL